MKVFITGASGFVGSAVVQELLRAGHQVRGLARSEASAEAVEAAGAEAFRGTLDDHDSLTRGATGVDAVIHLAFNHDFSRFEATAAADEKAIAVLGKALAGSGKPFVVAGVVQRTASTEQDEVAAGSTRQSEPAALALLPQGVKAIVVRLPPSVHDAGDYAFVPYLIQVARAQGKAAYVGDGLNRWPAVHRLDVAHLFRLALEQGEAGSRYHGVAEAGIPFRTIAEAIGRRLQVPVVSLTADEAPAYFGWIAHFASSSMTISSELTRQRLNWYPTHLGLLADMEAHYFNA